MRNRLKALCAAGKPAMNGWCGIGTACVADILAAATGALVNRFGPLAEGSAPAGVEGVC